MQVSARCRVLLWQISRDTAWLISLKNSVSTKTTSVKTNLIIYFERLAIIYLQLLESTLKMLLEYSIHIYNKCFKRSLNKNGKIIYFHTFFLTFQIIAIIALIIQNNLVPHYQCRIVFTIKTQQRRIPPFFISSSAPPPHQSK